MTTSVRWDPFRELDLFDRVRGFGPVADAHSRAARDRHLRDGR